MSLIPICAWFVGILITAGAGPVQAQSSHALSQVNKIYVQPLGNGKLGQEFRSRVIERLRKKGDLIIVDEPAQADAVMSGTAEVWVAGRVSLSPRSPSTTQQAMYTGFLSARVTGKDNEVLWSYLVTPRRSAWGGIVNDLADSLAAKLLEARKEREVGTPVASQPESAAVSIRGAGATFPAPLYQMWFQSIQQQRPNEQITYDAVGSEAGIRLLAEGKVDFATSDMPLSDERMAQSGTMLQHFASVLGAVVPIYNLAGVVRPLNFTPEVLAEIYLGKIKRWNDPKIRAANHGVTLSESEIVVVHRSDGSGTTFVWSDFLSKVNPEWGSAVGRGSELKWPVGIGAEHNEGVAATVKQTPNAIGYVEMVFALQHQLSYGAVRNAAGAFVRADLASVREAASSAAAHMTSDFRVSITNAPGKDAYPITSFTWLLMPKNLLDASRQSVLHQLVEWVLTAGQKQCSELGYAPLPSEVVARELDALRK
jgi:phosphate ABC transporter phosphate-binding protein